MDKNRIIIKKHPFIKIINTSTLNYKNNTSMKYLLLFWSLFLFSSVNAQDTPDQGLLWEITGNGIEKPSYLYGTMHVSRKIAFNLDDVFYQSLKKADMVAVESMPDNWLDNLFDDNRVGYGGSITGRQFMGYGYGNRDFYKTAFQMNFPDKMDIVRSMFGQYQLINGLLYRSEGQVDFEEDTYLDMFIYQTGKRFDKRTYSLEGHEESRDLVEKAVKAPRKDEVDEWLKKEIEKNGGRYNELIQDAYRDRNIGLIDSINRAINSEVYMENMLYKRNENMVDSMETLMKTGSLFAGVGAAHLPGELGMIDLLRKRGYTLKPLFSEQTDKGKNLKSAFEANFIEKEYRPQTTRDGFITMNTPHKLYEMYADGGSISVSPDYDNGAYVTISRVYTYNLLRKPIDQLDESDLEKLLFEFIPGEILSKKAFQTPYPGFDIQNITKTGNHQRYLFYVTPLEIIIMKMDGKKEFVKKEGDKIFSTVQFSVENTSNEAIVSDFGGFEVEMSGYAISNNLKYNGKRFVQAYDTIADNYAFLIENHLNDLSYIEEDSFELYYLQEQFCENISTEFDENGHYKVKNNIPSFYSSTVLDSTLNKRLYLCSRVLGERYYLLGFLGEENDANSFFEKVKIKTQSNYSEAFERQEDTTFFYTVDAPEKTDKSGANQLYYQGRNQQEQKKYASFSKNQTYSIGGNEEIAIKVEKYHDWKVVENIDSIWSAEAEILKDQGLELTNQKAYQKDSLYYWEALATRENSLRTIRFKYILNHGALYSIRGLVHEGIGSSSFVDTFFMTFAPQDTVIGLSPLMDKSDLFFKAIEAQDSIILNSSQYVNFEDKHFEAVKKLFLEKEFKEGFEFLKQLLLTKILKMDYEMTSPFLEKLYLDSYENSNYQVQVLRTIINQRTKEGNKKMLELLEQDIPIADGGGDFLNGLTDSTKRINAMFPALLEYESISDYKYDIQGLLANAVKFKDLSPRKYKSLKKQFLNEGGIELKRAIGKQKQNKSKGNDYYYSNYNSVNGLNRYVDLLYPFKKDKKIKAFFDKVNKLDNPDLQMNWLNLRLLNKESIDKAVVQKLAENDEHKFAIYRLLKRYDSEAMISDSLRSKAVFSKLFATRDVNYGETLDSIYFLRMEEIRLDGELKDAYYFVMKTKMKDSYNDYLGKGKNYKKSSIVVMVWDKDSEVLYNNFERLIRMIKDEETEEETIEEMKKEWLLRGRKRIQSNGRNNYPSDFY